MVFWLSNLSRIEERIKILFNVVILLTEIGSILKLFRRLAFSSYTQRGYFFRLVYMLLYCTGYSSYMRFPISTPSGILSLWCINGYLS